jgi:hypothetical protein
VGDTIPEKQVPPNGQRICWENNRVFYSPFGINYLTCTPNQLHVGRTIQVRSFHIQSVRKGHIVCIQNGHILAKRGLKPSLSREFGSLSDWVPQTSDASIAVGTNDFVGSVRRGILNHQKLKVSKRLTEHAPYRQRQVSLGIPHSH